MSKELYLNFLLAPQEFLLASSSGGIALLPPEY